MAHEKSGDFRGKTFCFVEYNFTTLPNSQFLGFFKKGQINICKSLLFELGIYKKENTIFDINPVLELKLSPVLV